MIATAELMAPHEVVDRWHTDHRNYARLLDVIEQQVDAFRAGKRPDFELLRLIVY
jgi:hypothetical protein